MENKLFHIYLETSDWCRSGSILQQPGNNPGGCSDPQTKR